jgi:hypothetical protein
MIAVRTAAVATSFIGAIWALLGPGVPPTMPTTSTAISAPESPSAWPGSSSSTRPTGGRTGEQHYDLVERLLRRNLGLDEPQRRIQVASGHAVGIDAHHCRFERELWQPRCLDDDCGYRGPLVSKARAKAIALEHAAKSAGTWRPAR